MANTIEIVISATNNASSIISGISDSVGNLGESISSVGASMTKATAITSAALGIATTAAIAYDESVTNAAAILGATVEEQEAMSDSLLEFSRTAGFGAQKTADAFFDIVSGVADASTHMAILEASTATAEAGQADLMATNSALISSMNAYSFGAEKATFASDVMTRTVQGGVLTMDQLASALPNVTTMAANLGIGFDEVGASMAFMTTKGLNANVASTAIRATMNSFLKPTESMSAALDEMGFSTGEAAIETLGFQGALDALNDTAVVAEEGMATVIGSSRALQTAMILTGEGAAEFAEDFIGSVEGATDAAGEIQFRAAQAHIDLLKSNVLALRVTIGNFLLPVLTQMADRVIEVIGTVIDWIGENEELTSKIVQFVAVLGTVGPVLFIIGKAITTMASPFGILILAITTFVAAWQTNFLGIADTFGPMLDSFVAGFSRLIESVGWFVDDIKNFGIIDAIKGAFGIGPSAEGESWIEGVLFTFGLSREASIQLVDAVITAFTLLSSFITSAMTLATDFISNTVIPIVQSLIDRLITFWGDVSPSLASLYDWFVTSALPTIVNAVKTILIPAIQLAAEIILGIWDIISPTLVLIFDWFVTTGLPAITDFINDVAIPMVQSLIDIISGIWEAVKPALTSLFDWFNEFGLPIITTAIDVFMALFTALGSAINVALDIITGDVEGAKEAVTVAFDALTDLIQGFLDFFTAVFQGGIELAVTAVSAVFDVLGINAGNVFDGMANVVQTVIDAVSSLVDWIGDIDLGILGDALGLVGGAIGDVGGFLGFASGTPYTGSGNPNAIAGVVHNQEAVIPRTGAPVIFPSPNGLILEGAGGGGGGTVNEFNVSVSVSENQLLTPEEAEENGKLLGQRIVEEMRFNG